MFQYALVQGVLNMRIKALRNLIRMSRIMLIKCKNTLINSINIFQVETMYFFNVGYKYFVRIRKSTIRKICQDFIVGVIYSESCGLDIDVVTPRKRGGLLSSCDVYLQFCKRIYRKISCSATNVDLALTSRLRRLFKLLICHKT